MHIELELRHQTYICIHCGKNCMTGQETWVVAMQLNQTDSIFLGMRVIICLLNHLSAFLHSSLEAEAAIENRDIPVDTFEQHTDSDGEFPFFYFLVNGLANSHSLFGAHNVKLVHTSLHKWINNFVDIEFALSESKEASSMVMDSFDNLFIQIHEILFVVTFEGIEDPSDSLDLGDTFKHDNNFPDHSVDTWTDSPEANNICLDLSMVKEIGRSGACPQVLLLQL